MDTVARFLRAYSSGTEELVWELPISGFDLFAFRAELKVNDPSNPMYDCWLLTEAHVPFICKYVRNPHGWNFKRYAYYVEANAV